MPWAGSDGPRRSPRWPCSLRRTSLRSALPNRSSLMAGSPQELTQTCCNRWVYQGLPATDPSVKDAERFRFGRLARQLSQEVEVAPLVGLRHVIEVELPVAPSVLRLRQAPALEAAPNIGGRHFQIDSPALDIQ